MVDVKISFVFNCSIQFIWRIGVMVSQRIANPSYELFRSTGSIPVFSAKCRGTLAGWRRSLENYRTAMFCEFESHPRRHQICRISVVVTSLPSKQLSRVRVSYATPLIWLISSVG